MSNNIINDKQWKRLAKLGESLIICLAVDLNGDGVPPRSDRFEALKLMREYLDIHDITTKPKKDRLNYDN